MGYVDIGEEDYWEGEGEDSEKSQDEPVDKGKKRKQADKESKGELPIEQDVTLSLFASSTYNGTADYLLARHFSHRNVSSGARKKQISAPTKAAKQSINKLFSAATGEWSTETCNSFESKTYISVPV